MKPSESNTAAYAGEVSRIGQSVVISGDISSRSDIRIDGQMEGKLYSEGRVVIGETAKIKGSIICNDIDLFGTVEGDVYVNNLLSVKATAVINGNINVRKLQVEMGASFNGTCSMISEDQFRKLASQVVTLKTDKPSAVKAAAPAQNSSPVQAKLEKAGTAASAAADAKSQEKPAEKAQEDSAKGFLSRVADTFDAAIKAEPKQPAEPDSAEFVQEEQKSRKSPFRY